MLGEADEQDLVLAAWPGEWSQDVFVVDDLKGARVSVGLPRHKATPAAASSPHGGAPAQRDYISPIGLWQRLAESSSLSPEGQRQIATARSSRDVALALLARPDLDEEARQQVLRGDGYAVPEALVTSGRLTSDEIAALVDHHPDSGDLYQAALCSPAGRTAAQRKIASLSFAEAAHVWLYSHIPSKKWPELAAELLPVILAAPIDSPSDGAPGDSRYERPSVIQSLASSLLPEQRLELLRSPSTADCSSRHSLMTIHATLSPTRNWSHASQRSRTRRNTCRPEASPTSFSTSSAFRVSPTSRSPDWNRRWRT
jgi:hypothetical protein